MWGTSEKLNESAGERFGGAARNAENVKSSGGVVNVDVWQQRDREAADKIQAFFEGLPRTGTDG